MNGIIDYPLVHPLKWVDAGYSLPQMVEGAGMYLKDRNGKRYLDGNSGLWNVSLGYKHPSILEQIHLQLEKLPYINVMEFSNPTTLHFCEMLANLLPAPLNKIALTCTGSESVELSIKLARQYHQLTGKGRKKTILALAHSYHGTYYGSMSASGMDRELTEDFAPKVPGFIFIETPYCGCGEAGEICSDCLTEQMNQLKHLFEEEGDTIAGFLLEPVVASGGIIPIPAAYLQFVQQLCEKHDVLLIFDEVATGLGRTGRMFRLEETGVVPDILCLSKGINSGYLPLGATVFSEKIYRTFLDSRTHIEHFSTQNGSPLSCAAGIATLRVLTQEGYLDDIRKKGAYLKRRLVDELSDTPYFHEVRGEGLMLGVSLTSGGTQGSLLSADHLGRIIASLRNKGLIVHPLYVDSWASGLTLFPSFIVTEEEMEKMVSIMKSILSKR